MPPEQLVPSLSSKFDHFGSFLCQQSDRLRSWCDFVNLGIRTPVQGVAQGGKSGVLKLCRMKNPDDQRCSKVITSPFQQVLSQITELITSNWIAPWQWNDSGMFLSQFILMDLNWGFLAHHLSFSWLLIWFLITNRQLRNKQEGIKTFDNVGNTEGQTVSKLAYNIKLTDSNN